MVGTVVVNFIAEVEHGNTVLALLIGLVFIFTFLFDFFQVMLETFMFYLSQFVVLLHAIRTLLV